MCCKVGIDRGLVGIWGIRFMQLFKISRYYDRIRKKPFINL